MAPSGNSGRSRSPISSGNSEPAETVSAPPRLAARRLRYGPNTLEERRRLSLPLKFLSRFRNPLVLILLVAAVISALTGDLTSFIIISTIVLMSAVLDTVQEYRAEQAAEHLKVSVALEEQVLRDGQEVTVLGRGPRPRRCRAAGRGRPGPGGWAPARGQGFLRQRGAADRRVLPGGEARARCRRRQPGSRRGHQRRLHGQLGDERLGPAAGLRHRRGHPARRDQQQPAAGAAALRLGAGHPPSSAC